jgi:hypothetical protein
MTDAEDQEFRDMEMKQAEERIAKLAELAADKFVDSHRHSLDILTLHQAYKRGYRDALVDLIIKGKELL